MSTFTICIFSLSDKPENTIFNCNDLACHLKVRLLVLLREGGFEEGVAHVQLAAGIFDVVVVIGVVYDDYFSLSKTKNHFEGSHILSRPDA